jgi:HAD superfamily hydrolase (TIGR01548 family)
VKRALLLDMDGVLVDTRESFDRAAQLTVGHYLGREVALAEIEAWRARGGYNDDWDLSCAMIREGGREVARGEMVERFKGFYWGDPKGSGVVRHERWMLDRAVAEQMRGRFPLGIITGRYTDEVEFALARCGMRELFGSVIHRDRVKHPKPDPEGIFKALSELGCESAWYVGDMIDDYRAAQAAAVDFIALCRPGGDGSRWKKLSVTPVLGHVHEVWDYVRGGVVSKGNPESASIR